MGLTLFSRRQLFTAVLSIILLIAAVAFVASECGKAHAAEPAKGEYFAAVSALYQQQFGGGIGMGYQFRSGVMLLGQVTYTYQDAISGTSSCRIGCLTCSSPWSTGEIGTVGGAITVAFPLRKATKK